MASKNEEAEEKSAKKKPGRKKTAGKASRAPKRSVKQSAKRPLRNPTAASPSPKKRKGTGAKGGASAGSDPVKSRRQRSGEIPVVGIGASAGGLEAFEKFLEQTPAESGAAFILVQHLDPAKKSILTPLLRRWTSMTVVEAGDGMRLEPDHVYVSPPNRQIRVSKGVLRLTEMEGRHGAQMPINSFLTSLAEDLHEAAIGVILSGAGSDGAEGLKRINEQAGLVIVQDPDTAAYDGMPRSAVESGVADFVLPVGQIPAKVIEHIRHGYPRIREAAELLPVAEQDHIQKIFSLLLSRTGNDFSAYKRNTIARRIARRMSVNRIAEIGQYVKYLREDPQEIDRLFQDLLIKVTEFFRDPEAFELLKSQHLRPLMEGLPEGRALRIWVPGCSTGEEAYSIAMMVRELERDLERSVATQIFATDVDPRAVETAREGKYPTSIAASVTTPRLARFFTKHTDHYRVRQEIREMIVFAVQNLIKDPPFSKLDLVSCRNLLIYLEPEYQKKIVLLFHYALRPEGILFLGSAETVGSFTHLFQLKDKKWKIYSRQAGPAAYRPVADFSLPSEAARQEAGKRRAPVPGMRENVLREFTDQLVLKRFSPPVAIVDRDGEAVYFHGETERYLKPSSGAATLKLVDMARGGLKIELSAGLRRASSRNEEVLLDGVRVKTSEGWRPVDVTIVPITEPASLSDLTLVVFETAASYSMAGRGGKGASTLEPPSRIRELEAELSSTKAYLQRTIEEQETANEELKSSNEELQSSNEELQSTNEELETSKEELQSVNEELATMNAEHHEKIQELMQVNSDMNNLLASSQIATVFLDTELRIKRFTRLAHEVIKLIDTDIGRPIEQIAMTLEYDGLVRDCREVLRSLAPHESDIRGPKGSWYRVRIMPYRTVENVIDGVIVTFEDTTEKKRLEEKLRKAEGEIRRLKKARG